MKQVYLKNKWKSWNTISAKYFSEDHSGSIIETLIEVVRQHIYFEDLEDSWISYDSWRYYVMRQFGRFLNYCKVNGLFETMRSKSETNQIKLVLDLWESFLGYPFTQLLPWSNFKASTNPFNTDCIFLGRNNPSKTRTAANIATDKPDIVHSVNNL